MDDKLLTELLKNKKEADWLEFKQKFEIYDAKGKLVPQQRDELIKDVLGLANGNSYIVRKTKYLIIGADNSKFDDNGPRVLHDVNYGFPTQSEIVKLLNSACTPAIVGLECEVYPYKGVNLVIITIHPTFDIHETIRELTASSQFNKHAVFMRQDEHTVLASVREGIEIQERKQTYRHEVANPSAAWLGALVGGLVTFLLWDAESKINQTNPVLSGTAVFLAIVTVGSVLGWEIGWVVQQFNSTRYDWRYWTNRKRVGFVLFMLLLFVTMYFWQIRK